MDTQITVGSWYNNVDGNTFEIVSKMAYLLGVPKHIFEKETEPPQIDTYNRLEYNKSARIVRNLCMIRTAIQRNYKRINDKMKTEFISILSMPDLIPMDCITQLSNDGVSFIKKTSIYPSHHIIEINRLISDRINNCKNLFPLWLNWEYVRELFVMPNGLTDAGAKAAADQYFSNISAYPYQVFMNWIPENAGNILYNDKKFVSILYESHNDYFEQFDKVSDVGSHVKGNIYDHIEESEKVFMMVDCENSDPYHLCATLTNLDSEYTSKITRILLFDDEHTVSAWRILEQYTDIPVEHMLIERVKQDKSLVDYRLVARACQEHYQNQVDSFILVSSDSDYWALITALPAAKFLVMVEHEKCGPDLRTALEDSGIFYCYIDEFYSGNADTIKIKALLKEMCSYLDDALTLNVNTMFSEALRATRIEMSTAERKQIFDKYIRKLKLEISDNGDVRIVFDN